MRVERVLSARGACLGEIHFYLAMFTLMRAERVLEDCMCPVDVVGALLFFSTICLAIDKYGIVLKTINSNVVCLYSKNESNVISN